MEIVLLLLTSRVGQSGVTGHSTIANTITDTSTIEYIKEVVALTDRTLVCAEGLNAVDYALQRGHKVMVYIYVCVRMYALRFFSNESWRVVEGTKSIASVVCQTR